MFIAKHQKIKSRFNGNLLIFQLPFNTKTLSTYIPFYIMFCHQYFDIQDIKNKNTAEC